MLNQLFEIETELVDLNHQKTAGNICASFYSCSHKEINPQKRKGKNQKERERYEKKEKQKNVDQEKSIEQSMHVFKALKSSNTPGTKMDPSLVNNAIRADDEKECIQAEEIKNQMHRYVEMKKDAYKLKQCYFCEAYWLRLRQTDSTSTAMSIQDATSTTEGK